ncbi:MAG: hypothetical protein BWK76_27320 [Desulfobulbaceae bacterium A2]|nr:MAG: hypothetical protein BWK76_27320 [Desulfobulbaceae bacterium A2]
MAAPDNLPAEAVASYRKLLAIYEDVARRLDEPDAPAVQELAERIAVGLAEVKHYDEQLAGSGSLNSPQRNSPCEQERRRLAELIQRQYELLFPRIHGIMALYHAEMEQIRHGRVGVNGYYPSDAKTGGRLKTSC